MLAVGDIPYKHYVDSEFEITSKEYIVSPENKPKLLEILDLNPKSCIPTGQYSQLFQKKGEVAPYIIISTDASLWLKQMLKFNMALYTDKLRMATPPVNYMYLGALSRHRFHDPISWLKVVTQARESAKFFYYNIREQDLREKWLKVGNKITSTFDYMSYINNRDRHPIIYEKYSKYELLKGIGGSINNAALKTITMPMNDNWYNETRFENELSDLMKKLSVMELIYLEMINQIFIPEHIISGQYPPIKNWYKYYMTTLMNFVTDPDNRYKKTLQEYIINNLEDIVKSYRADVVLNFMRAEENNKIKPKQSWVETFQNPT